ncbi:M16 family metallopeptidase [Bacteroides fragilis]|uniref:M16 family metallopeptidase n=1 Tax=Bacteroides fragilis TaxID=817 RepID=UPI00044BB45D|nr:pitrilysin family protein [Bacteroides fragilis]EXY42803.1 peptidase M16 inactive domain protein [Bacteroides fragilis str. 3774 T13]MCB6707667.1 insulinase family protein [Bacteroides fragilis]MCE8563883.1 insulinase family protein [Bacteroides fragilis]MCE8637582.1 insulinase family protein [Bacteroides fragilis]MCE8792196.1 insulinase family protein [Bacteroides fragilis]
MQYNIHTLSNGLRIIHEPSSSKVAYCGFAVDAGTRDEAENEQGMAHFVEHLIFKGTRKRKAWHILNRMENVGGDLNAYTNKEETVIYSAFLTEHFGRALELLADIVFHSTFPQNEIEKETEVIIDEIQSYEDTPSELIFDDFEDMIFRNHPLGRNILGRPDLLKKFRSEDAMAFTSRFYQPSNMVFFVLGDFNFQKIVRQVEKLLVDLPLVTVENQRTIPPLYVPEQLVVHKETHQAHVMIGSRGYNAYDDKRTALYLLNNILGGPGMNSRLNVSLRERRGLVYTVESNLTSYTDTGAFCIYFGTDPEDVDTCLKLTYKELKRMRDVKMTSSQLMAAKKQLIGQIGVASDNNENNALGMAKTFLHYNKYESSESVFRRIEALTVEGLLEVANEMFAEEYLSTLIYR